MKKILIVFLGGLVLLAAAALIAPSFIDWNSYRGEIAAEVRKATGRTLAIDGGIDVALLPAPKLTVTKARLSNVEGAADPDMVRLGALDLRVALWPLLSGKVVVKSVVLRGADIRLEKLADGRDNWTFAAAPQATRGGGSGQSRRGRGGGGAGDSVSLQQVIIESSALSFRDSAKGTVLRVDGIRARIAAATLSGPFAARGEFRYSGVPVGFELRSGRIETGASTDLALKAQLIESKAKLSYSGSVTPGTPGFTTAGKLKAQGPDLGALIAALGRAAGGEKAGSPQTRPALAKPFTVTAGIAGGADILSIEDIAAEVGGTRASAELKITSGAVTNVDGSVTIGRLDLDRWLAGVGTAPAGASGKGGAAAAKNNFSLPRDLSVAVEARIEGVTFKKGLVRNLRSSVVMEKGTLRIKTLEALLPGDTKTAVSGSLRARSGKPHFEGRVRLDSNDFRAMLRWLGGDDGALPADRLHKVGFRAGLGFAPDRVELRDIDLRFDSSKVSGGMVVALRDRIGIGARLDVDRLNLDAYMPRKGAPASAATSAGEPKAAGGAGPAALAAFDANFNVTARRLTYGGERIDGLAVEGTLAGGDLTIRNLTVAGLAGARVEAKGIVRKLDKTPIPDVTLRVAAKDPRRLFRLAPFQVPDAVGKLGPLAVEGRLTAENKRTRFDLNAALGKVKLGAKGAVAGLGDAPRADLDFRLNHPDFVTFVRLFDPGFKPEKPVRGPFSVAATISGAGLDLKLEKFAAQFGRAKFSGAATLSLAAARPLLKADLQADEIIADHFLAGPQPEGKAQKAKRTKRGAARASGGAPWTDEPIDIDMLKLIDADLRIRAAAIAWRRWRVADPRLDLTLENGRLDLRRLTGAIVGGSFHMTGSVAAPAKAGGALRTRLDLDVARMDLHQAMFNAADIDIAKGKVDFKMALSGAGKSSRAIARSLAGSGSLAATEGEVSGFDLARVNERISRLNDAVSLLTLLQTAMAGGSTRFSRLSGTFGVKGGVLRSNDVSIIADGGTGAGKLMVDIGHWLMDGDIQFRLSGNAKAPPFSLRLKGPLDAPRRIIKANALQAWLANRAAGALMNQFMGQPKQGGGTADGGSQQQPTSKDQFIKGIFDLLRK